MENYLPVLAVVGWLVTVLGVAFGLPYILNSTSGTKMGRNADSSVHDESRGNP